MCKGLVQQIQQEHDTGKKAYHTDGVEINLPHALVKLKQGDEGGDKNGNPHHKGRLGHNNEQYDTGQHATDNSRFHSTSAVYSAWL